MCHHRFTADTTTHLRHYTSPVAILAALLLLLTLAVRLVAVPLCLTALLADRTAARLDRWLAALPTLPQPVHATATRTPRLLTALPHEYLIPASAHIASTS